MPRERPKARIGAATAIAHSTTRAGMAHCSSRGSRELLGPSGRSRRSARRRLMRVMTIANATNAAIPPATAPIIVRVAALPARADPPPAAGWLGGSATPEARASRRMATSAAAARPAPARLSQRYRREQSIGARGGVTRPVKTKPIRHDDQQPLPPVRARQLHAKEPRVRARLIPKLRDRPQVVGARDDRDSDREACAVCRGHRGNQLALSRRHAGRLRVEEDLIVDQISAGRVGVGARDPAPYHNQCDRQRQHGARATGAVRDARPSACKPAPY